MVSSVVRDDLFWWFGAPPLWFFRLSSVRVIAGVMLPYPRVSQLDRQNPIYFVGRFFHPRESNGWFGKLRKAVLRLLWFGLSASLISYFRVFDKEEPPRIELLSRWLGSF